MKEFPDWFTGISRFPGEYTIWLRHDIHPMLHTSRKMPHCLASKGQGTPWQDGMPGSDHPCRWAHGLGVLNLLHPEGQWWATSVFRSPWPQQNHLPWSPQDAHCGGCCPQVCTCSLFNKVGCLPWILVNHSWSGIQPTHNLQQSLWKILFPMSSLWPCLLSRHLPEEDRPDPRRVPRMHWDHRWHHCPWSHWSRTWCPSMEPYTCCLQIWVSVNPQKTHVKAPSVTFLGCLYDTDGVPPDSEKVNAIHDLPAPTNITELKEFLGIVMCLSPFIPGLSTLTAPLYELLRKDTDFTWNHTYDAAFQCVKDAVISNTMLWYFDPSLPMTIQIDASQVGLGAVLLQNNKPIPFDSKALTKTECHYANIEREMFAVTFGAERFRNYIYGRSFVIESDHKPLESISPKNLADMPAWLQCMLLCLQGYDYIIHYHPSKEMALPDTLSCFSPCPGPDIPLDIAIYHAHLSPQWKAAFQQAFMSDPKMCALANIIITSWPDDIKAVLHPLHPYWQHHETLTIEDGPVLHGEALVVPPSERERVLHQLHQFHQGITKSHLLTWMNLLAWFKESHWKSCLSVWGLQLVPSPECCSTPQTYINPILPMADVCHGHLYPGGSWLPHMSQHLLKDDPHLMSSIWPEQQHQSHLTAQGNVLRAWNPRSPSLW